MKLSQVGAQLYTVRDHLKDRTRLRVPRMVQQRDLLGITTALEEFGELGLKLDEAYNNDAAAS